MTNQEQGKLGKLPYRHDDRTLHLAHYLDPSVLPHVPVRYEVTPNLATTILLNDSLGDCTIAAAFHRIQAVTTAAGDPFTPTDAEALQYYEQICGYDPSNPSSDQGGVLLDVCSWWRRQGLSDHKIGAFVSVNIRNPAEVRAAIYLFEGLYIGLALPVTAQRQGIDWKVTNSRSPDAQPGSWGGHAVYIGGYNAGHYKDYTWGQEGQMSVGFAHAYMDEAWAIVSEDALEASGKTPEGLDINALNADLHAVAA